MNALVLLVCIPSQSYEDEARVAMTFAIAHRARNAAKPVVAKHCGCSVNCTCGCQQGEPCECDNQKAIPYVQSVPQFVPQKVTAVYQQQGYSAPVPYARPISVAPVTIVRQPVPVPVRQPVRQPVWQLVPKPVPLPQPLRYTAPYRGNMICVNGSCRRQ